MSPPKKPSKKRPYRYIATAHITAGHLADMLMNYFATGGNRDAEMFLEIWDPKIRDTITQRLLLVTVGHESSMPSLHLHGPKGAE